MHYKNCTSSVSKKTPAHGGSSSKSIKVQLIRLLNNVSTGLAPKFNIKISTAILHQYQKSVCGNNLRLNLAFKVPERWAPRLNRVARWYHQAIEHCRGKLGCNKKTMCVFGHKDNQILNSPGVCAADSWSHQGPIECKKEKSGTQPIVSSTWHLITRPNGS